MTSPDEFSSPSQFFQTLKVFMTSMISLIRSEIALWIARAQSTVFSRMESIFMTGLFRSLYLLIGLFSSFLAFIFFLIALVFALKEWLDNWALSFLSVGFLLSLVAGIVFYFAFRSKPKKTVS